MTNIIDSPAHYAIHNIEPITFIMGNNLPFWKGNIIKYSLRQGKKDSPDADKALHYMQKLKELSDSGW